MGGKVWSDIEEEIFWTVLARRAPPGFHKESKAKKKSHHELAKSWEPLIDVMKSHMLQKNPEMTQDDLPRRYSAISIYEHWFQNLVQGKFSPNAGRHVREHQAWLKGIAEKPESAPESLKSRTMSKKQKHRAAKSQQKQVMPQPPMQQQPAHQVQQQQQDQELMNRYMLWCEFRSCEPSPQDYLNFCNLERSIQQSQQMPLCRIHPAMPSIHQGSQEH